MKRMTRLIWLPALFLLFFWVNRTVDLLALPLFLDEASHLTRAQWVWEGKPLYLLETGKALGPYLAALFWPYSGAIFIGRYVVVLLSAVGLAAAYATGRELHSPQVGLLAMALWIVSPQLFFYERMALVDTTMGAMAVLALWLALRAVRDGRALAAVLCGVALALTVLAKLTGLVFLPIPALAALFAPAQTPWQWRMRQMIAAYAVFGALMTGPLLYIRSVEADPTGQRFGVTTLDADTLAQRVTRNLGRTWDAQRAYFSDAMLLVIAAAALIALTAVLRRALILLALMIGLFSVVIVTGAAFWQRYISPATPFMLLLTALGLVTGAQLLHRLFAGDAAAKIIWAGLPWLITGWWLLGTGLPFHLTAYRSPAALPLPARDRIEYVRWIPAGFGIREAAIYLLRLNEPMTVIGTAVNCESARLYLPHAGPVRVVCPPLDWGGRAWRHVVEIMSDLLVREGTIYVLSESKSPPTVPISAWPGRRTLIREFVRPGGDYPVQLYRLAREGADSGFNSGPYGLKSCHEAGLYSVTKHAEE